LRVDQAEDLLTEQRKQRLLLLTGIPGTGKSEMGRFLEREHGFVHVDVEAFLEAPPPKTHADILRLAERQKATEKDVVITWGFMPGQDEAAISSLQQLGFQLVWFDGDREAALNAFKRRGFPPIQLFHAQMRRIEKLDLDAFKPHCVNPFKEGEFLAREIIAERLLIIA